MCKYVLIALIVLLIVLMVVAAVVVQEYGWTGFLIMLGALVVLAFIAKKTFPRVFRYLLMRPMRQMGAALRGGRIVVHSIAPTEAPDDLDYNPYDEEHQALLDEIDYQEEEDQEQRPNIHFDWYHVELTVFPPGPESSEGVTRYRAGWTPDLIGARHIRPGKKLEHPLAGWPTNLEMIDFDLIQFGGIEIWDGVEYVQPGEPVFGEQQLRLTVGIGSEVSEAAIVYANFTEIGKVQFPRLNITPESTS